MIVHRDVERLALLGWRLHPASQYSRAACIKDATELATCDLNQLDRWSWEFPGCGWRVVMQGSGIWALDIDVPGADHVADGAKALADLVAVHGPLPPGPTTRSGGGGSAIFFSHTDEPIIGKTGTPAPGLDPRRGRQTVTVPPSIHPRRRQPYSWLLAPWDVSPPPAPPWLLRLVVSPAAAPVAGGPARLAERSQMSRRYVEAALRDATIRVATALEGQRNDTLNREVFAMLRFVADGSLDAADVALAMAQAGRQAGLEQPEIQSTLTSALRARMRS